MHPTSEVLVCIIGSQLNSCTGTANPTASPVFDNPQDGCPEEFDSGTTYEANDRVSVTREDGRS
eukprot:scaffold37932_cov173-Skeletonema_marinoi.AAC.2